MATQSGSLNAKQIEWCRAKIPHFRDLENSHIAARKAAEQSKLAAGVRSDAELAARKVAP